MPSEHDKVYRRQYMKKYYNEHKGYWQNYYLKKKGSSKKPKRKSYHNRRSYLAKINAAWHKPNVRKSRLSRIIRRFGRTPNPRFNTRTIHSQHQTEKVDKSIEYMNQFRRTILEIFTIEDFHNIRFPQLKTKENVKGNILSQAFALKDNRRCIIEFSTSPFKAYTTRRKDYLRTLLSFFNSRYFLCFVKPDLSTYKLLELDPSNIRSVTLALKTISTMKPTPRITRLADNKGYSK
jgi:hypothetical protein